MSAVATAAPRWTRRKDARPAELLRAALDLFVERGYAGTRLEDVAARAGVSKGLLYLYFDSKEALFKAVVRASIVVPLADAAAQAARYEGSAAELLRELVQRWWREYGAAPAGGLSKLMLAESGNFPEIARFFLDEAIEPWYALLAQTLERGIARGEFRRIEAPLYARVLGAPLVMLALWQRSFGPCSRRPLDPDAYLAAAVDSALAALRRLPRTASLATKRTNGDVKRRRRAPRR
jgi:AcrR family transcriptional regulator